jgi:hypothetical protein
MYVKLQKIQVKSYQTFYFNALLHILRNFVPLLWGVFKVVKSGSTKMHLIYDSLFRLL